MIDPIFLSLLFHFVSVVSLILEAALAANATASTASTAVNSGGGGGGGAKGADSKKPAETEKNKRQIEQFLGSPGASIDGTLGYDNVQLPQAYPLQLSHGIYNQPLYTRRPTTGSSKSPVLPEDDVIEQERQLQSQQQVCSSNPIQSNSIYSHSGIANLKYSIVACSALCATQRLQLTFGNEVPVSEQTQSL